MKKIMHSSHLPTAALRMRRRAGARAQAGLSLVELMVGMAIGMLVVLAALGTIMFTRTSASTMSSSSRLEQQANLTVMLLGRQIMQAAAMNMQALPVAAAANPASAAPGAGAQELLFYTERPGTGFTDTDRQKFDQFAYNGLDGKPGGSGTRPLYLQGADAASATQGDTLVVSYPMLDATGAVGEGNCINDPAVGFPAAVTGAGVRTMQFVSSVTTSGDISQPQGGSLVCGTPAALTKADATGTARAATSQPIASGVRDFQVRYLRSVDPNAVSSNASDLTTRDDWAGVRGVEICLHMVSANVSAAAATPVLGCRGEAIANDARIHKVVRQVFYLRNSGSV